MGKYQKNIEAARRITVMQYLETYHPGELVRKTDREYLLEDIYKHEFWHFYKYQYECIPHKYVLEFFGICFIAL